MPHDQEQIYVRALEIAQRFLGGSAGAGRACASLDDLAQTAALQTVQSVGALRRPSRFRAFVHTISRRVQTREWQRSRVWRQARALDAAVDVAAPPPCERFMCIEGEWHELPEAIAAVERAVEGLGHPNADLMRGFYDGMTCEELGAVHGLAPSVVKVRIYRCRRRLRGDVLERLGRFADANTKRLPRVAATPSA